MWLGLMFFSLGAMAADHCGFSTVHESIRRQEVVSGARAHVLQEQERWFFATKAAQEAIDLMGVKADESTQMAAVESFALGDEIIPRPLLSLNEKWTKASDSPEKLEETIGEIIGDAELLKDISLTRKILRTLSLQVQIALHKWLTLKKLSAQLPPEIRWTVSEWNQRLRAAEWSETQLYFQGWKLDGLMLLTLPIDRDIMPRDSWTPPNTQAQINESFEIALKPTVPKFIRNFALSFAVAHQPLPDGEAAAPVVPSPWLANWLSLARSF